MSKSSSDHTRMSRGRDLGTEFMFSMESDRGGHGHGAPSGARRGTSCRACKTLCPRRSSSTVCSLPALGLWGPPPTSTTITWLPGDKSRACGMVASGVSNCSTGRLRCKLDALVAGVAGICSPPSTGGWKTIPFLGRRTCGVCAANSGVVRGKGPASICMIASSISASNLGLLTAGPPTYSAEVGCFCPSKASRSQKNVRWQLGPGICQHVQAYPFYL